MNYRLTKPNEKQSLVLPISLVDKLGEIGEEELKFILAAYGYCAMHGEEIDSDGMMDFICEKTGIAKEKSGEYMAFWRGAGFMKTGSKRKKTTVERKRVLFDSEKKPSYSSMDIAKAGENNVFRDLVDYAQNRLKKTFNTSELATLYSFMDYLKMPVEVVMLVIENCASKGKGSLRYVEKVLISFADTGIDTYQKAEEYIQESQRKQDYENKVRALIGLGIRALTGKEKAALAAWSTEYKMPFELIALAYEKTINAIHQPSIPYMNTILEGWFREGITSKSQVENKIAVDEWH